MTHVQDRRMRTRDASVMAVLLIGCVACSLAEPQGCDLCTTSAVVYGVVRDEGGSPVPGAVITIDVFFADTARFRGSLSAYSRYHPTQSNAAGAFRDQPFTPMAPFRARLKEQVIPPSAFADTVTVDNALVDFRSDYRGPVRDSVRIDFVVRRQAP